MDTNLRRELVDIRNVSGARRAMGESSPEENQPHYHLLRKFKGDVDLLIILNTKRCYYNCSFCDLPAKSSRNTISSKSIIHQMLSVFRLYADSLDVMDRITVSNEGSVFDYNTVDSFVLAALANAITAIPNVGRLVLETRPEFVTSATLDAIQESAPRCIIDILIGFETQDDKLRNVTLGKRQSKESLTVLLDMLATRERVALTSYALVKPGFAQSDAAGIEEAQATIRYLAEQTAIRQIPLSVRLNPMYIPTTTRWGRQAQANGYLPPRLSDVFNVALWAERHGIPAYVGLSTEGLANPNQSYRCRDDFGRDLLKRAIFFNNHAPNLGNDTFPLEWICLK